MNRLNRTTWIAIVGFFFLIGIVSLVLADEAVADFTGSWKLNEQESEMPEPGRRTRGSIRGHRGGTGGPGGMRGSGGPGGLRGGGFGGGPRGMRPEPGDGSRGAMEQFRVESDAESMTVIFDGRDRTIWTDGRTFATIGFGGEEIVTHEKQRGGSMSERWALSESGEKLTITRTMARGPRAGERPVMTLVYDRVDGGE